MLLLSALMVDVHVFSDLYAVPLGRELQPVALADPEVVPESLRDADPALWEIVATLVTRLVVGIPTADVSLAPQPPAV